MKYVFLGSFAFLSLLSGVAWLIQPEHQRHGKTPLIWVSDPNPARREQVSVFNDLHPQYDLKLDPNNSGMAKVIVQSLAGVGPDIFDCYGGFDLSGYVKAGVAWDVTDELAAFGIRPLEDCWTGSFSVFVLDGRVYGMPTNVSVNAIWYNKDIFDACGVPYPKGECTWEQFIPLAQKLTVKDQNGRPKHFGLLADWWGWKQFVYQYGGRVYSEDGTRCVLDSPGAIAGMQLFHDLMYKYHVMPSPSDEQNMATTGGWGSGTITLFSGGRGAMAVGGRWWLCTLRDNKKLRLGVVPAPFGPKKVYWAYGRASLVNKNSPRRREALDFLRYLAGREYNDLINHQADALAPIKKYCYTPEYLHDPEFPAEDYNDVWRDVMRYGIPEEISPFVDGHAAGRLIDKQLDLVRSDEESVEKAMRNAARQVNEEIQKTLARDPQLRERYDRTLGGRRP
jgi:multiple sugar transport system substrate-binding protein